MLCIAFRRLIATRVCLLTICRLASPLGPSSTVVSYLLEALPILPIYQAASAAFAPLSPVVLYCGANCGATISTAMARGSAGRAQPRPDGPLAWLHGASVGESLALLPLVERLSARGFTILVSTGTSSAAAVIAPRLPAGALHQFLPLDVPQFLARFLAYWRPNLALIAESEIWPNLFLADPTPQHSAAAGQCADFESSFQRWRWFPSFIGTLLGSRRFMPGAKRGGCGAFRAAWRATCQNRRAISNTMSMRRRPTGKVSQRSPCALGRGRFGSPPRRIAARRRSFLPRIRRWRNSMPGLSDHHHAASRASAAARLPTLLARAASRSRSDRPSSKSMKAHCRMSMSPTRPANLDLFYRLTRHRAFGQIAAAGPNGGQNPDRAAKLGCADLARAACCQFRAESIRRSTRRAAPCRCRCGHDRARCRDPSRRCRPIETDGARGERDGQELGGACERIMSAIEPHLAQLSIESRDSR